MSARVQLRRTNRRPALPLGGRAGARAASSPSSGAGHDWGYGTGTCPTCGLVVGKRKDGRLRGHRVGTRKSGWLCAGEEA